MIAEDFTHHSESNSLPANIIMWRYSTLCFPFFVLYISILLKPAKVRIYWTKIKYNTEIYKGGYKKSMFHLQKWNPVLEWCCNYAITLQLVLLSLLIWLTEVYYIIYLYFIVSYICYWKSVWYSSGLEAGRQSDLIHSHSPSLKKESTTSEKWGQENYGNLFRKFLLCLYVYCTLKSLLIWRYNTHTHTHTLIQLFNNEHIWKIYCHWPYSLLEIFSL